MSVPREPTAPAGAGPREGAPMIAWPRPEPVPDLPDPSDAELFPLLSRRQIALIRQRGRPRRYEAGETVYDLGQRDAPFLLLLSGHLDFFDETPKGERRIARAPAGTIIGEMATFTGRPALATCRAPVAAETIVLEREDLTSLVAERPEVGDLILRTLTHRRTWHEGHGYGQVRLIGHVTSARTFELREFLARHRVPFRFDDPDLDPETAALVRCLSIGPEELPVIVRGHGVYRNPDITHMAEKLGLRRDLGTEPFDLAVIGAGPAGLAAAVYGASEGYRTVLLDSTAPGGQAGSSSRIENYLGFPTGISGGDLAGLAMLQVIKFGATLSSPHSVRSVAAHPDGGHLLELDDGQRLRAGAVIVASGASYRLLGVPGETALRGAGVFYAATGVEGEECADAEVIVVGGGNSAGQAAMFLAERARRVTVVIRRDSLAATMSRYLIDRIARDERIDVLPGHRVTEILGSDAVEAVRVADHRDAPREIPAGGVFVMIGADPCTDFLGGYVALGEKGFVPTGQAAAASPLFAEHWGALQRGPTSLETTRPLVFAVGDVREGASKRVATAVGEGSMAIRLLAEATADGGLWPSRSPEPSGAGGS